jgi:transposase
MSDDSADKRAVGAHPESFSGRAHPDGRPGRKPIPTRRVFEAVLWILNTGAQWHMLPQSYPNYKSVHRRFQTWCRDEVWLHLTTIDPFGLSGQAPKLFSPSCARRLAAARAELHRLRAIDTKRDPDATLN